MDPRLKASVLWGLIGALSFLVLAQGYVLVTSEGIDAVVMVAVAALVAVGATALTYVAQPRVPDGNESP